MSEHLPKGNIRDNAGQPETGTQEVPGRARQTRQRLRPETRAELLERLVNPHISLHEASILLKVCPATVRTYTRSGRLPDLRTPGGQRRFRFRDVMLLARELDKKK